MRTRLVVSRMRQHFSKSWRGICNKTRTTTKRGDTITEVMIAFSIFSMVAVMTVTIMNSGVASTERSLELVTARNELNAQAEALRFIQSSYVSELTLPKCTETTTTDFTCQKYDVLWKNVRLRALGGTDDIKITYPPDVAEGSSGGCHKIYDDGDLDDSNVFIINPRALPPSGKIDSAALSGALITEMNLFKKPLLNARILYSRVVGGPTNEDIMQGDKKELLTEYTTVAAIEGIWVFGVAGPKNDGRSYPDYYDFYIETCWNGTDTTVPTTLDTIIRLYNSDDPTK